jgi:hypothetical protein
MVTPTDVRIRRISSANEHEAQKWLVIEGSLEGCPAVTKRESINVAALASGDLVLAERVQKMRDDVVEYYGRWLELANIPTDL